MIIESLELKNFGSHESLTAGLNASVVGVMGPNGSGKSTILRAIEFALTGGLEDKADTYVRLSNGEKPASNADVTLTFRKNGHHGKIYRRVGKSPKRTLLWDNKEITKAADIDAILRDVFCADKQAISNAIFPGQGSLDRLLFGNQAERETLFMRLMLLGHLNTVENVVDGQIQRLSGMMQDFSSIEDSLNEQQNTVVQQISELTSQLAGMCDYTGHIACVNKAIEIANQLDAAQARCSELNSLDYAQQQVVINNLRQELATHCQISAESDYSDFAAKIQELQNTYRGLSSQRDQLVAQKNKHDNFITVKQDVDALNKEKDSLYALLNSLQTKVEAFSSVSQELLAAKRAYVKADEEAKGLREQHEVLVKKLKGIAANRDDLSVDVAIPKREAAITEIKTKIADRSAHLNITKAVLNLHGCENTETQCPICNSAVSDDIRELAKETSGKLETQIQELSSELNRQVGELTTLQQANQTLLNEHLVTSEKIKQLNQRMSDIKVVEDPSTSSVSELEELVARKEELVKKIVITKTQIESVEKNIQSSVSKFSREDWDNLSVSIASASAEVVAEINTVNAALSAVNDSITLIQSKLNYYNSKLQAYHKQVADLEAAKNVLKSVEAEATTTEEQYALVVKYISGYLNKIGQDPVYTTKQEWLGYLRGCEETRIKIQGMLQAFQQQQQQLAVSRTELEAKKLNQIKLVLVVEEMRQLKRTFTRQGLPISYLNYKFEKLTELTQHNLNLLGSNILIRPDPETPLSFLFKRMDQPGIDELPQYKMSGGQRVRLSIAFLLAVQQLVLPEVSLLVLDEPSLHLDHEAVESLRDLLQNLGSTLASSEAQVIVCDHNPILLPAMGKVVNLSNTK